MTQSTTNIRPLRLANPTDRYEFEPAFERALIYACCTVSRFWGLIGTHLNPDCLNDKRGALLLKACGDIARETGEGPSRATTVLQRLVAVKDSGKITQQDLDLAAQLLEDVDDLDGGIPSVDDLVSQAGAVLRRRARNELTVEITRDNGKGKPLTRYAAKIEAIERIGQASAIGATRLADGVWAAIDELRRADRMPFGILGLDEQTGGGVYSRSLTTIGAATNVGKTAMLVHIACYNWMLGKRVIFVPTEESVASTIARMISWITGCTLDQVNQAHPDAKARFSRLLAAPGVGSLVIEYLPQGSTVGQLRQLVDQAIEDHPDFDGYDILLVDYADKLDAPGDSPYVKMKAVYEGIRQIAVDNGNWAVTASQLKTLERKKIPDANDLSDSLWKGRISDAVVTIWRPEDGDQDDRFYHMAKNRGPGAGAILGPLPAEPNRARMAPLPTELLLADEDDFL